MIIIAPYLKDLVLCSNSFLANGFMKLVSMLVTNVKNIARLDVSNCDIRGPDYIRMNAISALLIQVQITFKIS